MCIFYTILIKFLLKKNFFFIPRKAAQAGKYGTRQYEPFVGKGFQG